MTKASKYTPTEENVMPPAVIERIPVHQWGNISCGRDIAEWLTMRDIVQTYNGDNPYRVMRAFAETYFREKREAVRILGNTKVNRFVFCLVGGERIYEVIAWQNGMSAIVDAFGFEAGCMDASWKNIQRKRIIRSFTSHR